MLPPGLRTHGGSSGAAECLHHTINTSCVGEDVRCRKGAAATPQRRGKQQGKNTTRLHAMHGSNPSRPPCAARTHLPPRWLLLLLLPVLAAPLLRIIQHSAPPLAAPPLTTLAAPSECGGGPVPAAAAPAPAAPTLSLDLDTTSTTCCSCGVLATRHDQARPVRGTIQHTAKRQVHRDVSCEQISGTPSAAVPLSDS